MTTARGRAGGAERRRLGSEGRQGWDVYTNRVGCLKLARQLQKLLDLNGRFHPSFTKI